MKTGITIAAIVLIAGGLFFLGGQRAPQSVEGPGTETPGSRGSGGGGASTLAPDFSLATLNGDPISLSDYRGDRPVILDFWASWCPNCRRDMPKLNRFYEKYEGQVEVIAVNLQENPATVRNFVESQGFSFPVVLDPDGSVARSYGVRYTNFHVLIDKEGNIAGTVPGDIRESDVLALINSSTDEEDE